jgi:hypothetical protein
MSGGAWYDFLNPNKNGVGDAFNKVKNEFVNPSSVLRHDVAPKIAHEFTDPNSVLRGKVLPEAAKYASYAAPVLDVAGTAVGLPGAGTMLSRGLSAAQYANQGAKAMGYGRRRGRGKCPMCGMKKCGCGTGCGTGGGRERDDVAFMRDSGYASSSDSSSDEEYNGGQSMANPSNTSMSGAYQGQGTGGNFRPNIDAETLRANEQNRRRQNMNPIEVLTDILREQIEPGFVDDADYRRRLHNARERAIEYSRPLAKATPNLPARAAGKVRGGKRAAAGADDGRRKRAAIVKKVMAERGLKMIEASKYVKEHGLY